MREVKWTSVTREHGVCVYVYVCVQFQGKLAEYAQRGKTIQGRIRQAEYVRTLHESFIKNAHVNLAKREDALTVSLSVCVCVIQDSRKGELTLQEVSSLPEDTPTYTAVGKAYVLHTHTHTSVTRCIHTRIN